jgi:hypothetical protein
MYGCVAVSDKRKSCLHKIRRLRNFGNKYVTKLRPDSTRYDVGKEIKYKYIFSQNWKLVTYLINLLKPSGYVMHQQV